jgi:hypothetical protein
MSMGFLQSQSHSTGRYRKGQYSTLSSATSAPVDLLSEHAVEPETAELLIVVEAVSACLRRRVHRRVCVSNSLK